MPLVKDVRDNLASAFTLAYIFTDINAEYLPLGDQSQALKELQRYIGWQAHNPFQRANPGHSETKRNIQGYLNLTASADLFLRFMTIPSCPVQNNLAYFSEELQNFLYQQFKHTILPQLLIRETLDDLSLIDAELKKWVREKIQGYAKRLPNQERVLWQVFVAEIDTGMQILSQQYKDILRPLHQQFKDFRKEHLQFTQNYFDRCLLIAKLEEWLMDVPYTRYNCKASDELSTQFNQKLTALDFSYNEIDLREHFRQLNQLRTMTLTQSQYKILVSTLIDLKPKYDAFRKGQDKLTPDEIIEKFMDAWPKPKFPHYTPTSVSKGPAEEKWNELRQEQRDKLEEVAENEPLKHKMTIKLN